MRRLRLVVLAALPLLGCNAPDYTPVGDWAGTASLAVDYPPAARHAAGMLTASAWSGPAETDDGVIAMQWALAVYLSSIGRMANDGLLPFREDPFLEVGPRAAVTSEEGGKAVATLGRLLRRATHQNARAPELRDTIATADPAVQLLLAALLEAVARPAALGPAAREEAAPAVERALYGRLLTEVGQGHAMLVARASVITRVDVVQEIRLAQDQLRRATLALPRPALAP